MSNIPQNLKYTEEHEWVRVDGDVFTIGITDHAQAALGDVVFLDLPEIGRKLVKGKAFGCVPCLAWHHRQGLTRQGPPRRGPRSPPCCEFNV